MPALLGRQSESARVASELIPGTHVLEILMLFRDRTIHVITEVKAARFGETARLSVIGSKGTTILLIPYDNRS